MKEGFIYIWYDRKRKMYYIGCHYGTIDDGYICSSRRMKYNYKNRPHDFKRRIVQKGLTREELLTEEYRWLQMIPKNELGKKYYNYHNHHFNHWTNTIDVGKIKKTMSEKIKEAMNRPEVREKMIPVWERHKTRIVSEETRKKLSEKSKGINLGKKMTEEAKQNLREKNLGKKLSEETKQKLREIRLNNPIKHTEETKQKISIAHKGKKLSKKHIEKTRLKRTGMKIGKKYEWKILGPDGSIYIENGIDIFAKEHGFCANNFRTRGKAGGFILLEKRKML
jgi:hypothetical protein